MPPVLFEQIDAEIADERRSVPEAPQAAAPPNPSAVADQIRRELAVIESRRARLVVD